ncbi:hypothetical protein KY359_00705 [Candidatus Woesearchaeota archaeon]|nr:hypothetical protein [Candidatus Woesearchaeota archaeon]
MEQMDTKQEVTRKFIIGMVMIVASLVIGKLILIPLFLFPGSNGTKMTILIVYICSWLMMLAGVGLAGWEGYRLATHKYREYKKKTIEHVKHHSKRAAETAVHHTKQAVNHTKNAAYKTKEIAQKTKCATRNGVDNLKKEIHHSERQLRRAARRRHGL